MYGDIPVCLHAFVCFLLLKFMFFIGHIMVHVVTPQQSVSMQTPVRTQQILSSPANKKHNRTISTPVPQTITPPAHLQHLSPAFFQLNSPATMTAAGGGGGGGLVDVSVDGSVHPVLDRLEENYGSCRVPWQQLAQLQDYKHFKGAKPAILVQNG